MCAVYLSMPADRAYAAGLTSARRAYIVLQTLRVPALRVACFCDHSEDSPSGMQARLSLRGEGCSPIGRWRHSDALHPSRLRFTRHSVKAVCRIPGGEGPLRPATS